MVTFNPENLRKAPEGGFPFKIKTARWATLILVKRDGKVYFAVNGGDKNFLKHSYEDGDLLALAWTGEYHTDIFHVTKDDLDRDYE
jgi:hypothetical protein